MRSIRTCDEGTDFAAALLTGDRVGAVDSTDAQLMAAFCEDVMQILVGAFSPLALWPALEIPHVLPGLFCSIRPDATGPLPEVVDRTPLCGQPAVRRVMAACPCGHIQPGQECGLHAANTDRLNAGEKATPTICGPCGRDGHSCLVATSPV